MFALSVVVVDKELRKSYKEMFIERREKTSVGGRMAKHQKLKKRQKKTRKSLIHTTPQKAKD